MMIAPKQGGPRTTIFPIIPIPIVFSGKEEETHTGFMSSSTIMTSTPTGIPDVPSGCKA